jgi:pimeloyl-ACP methyl ester carboxylesterase
VARFVLVHGAWHNGELLEPVAKSIRQAGHQVYLPTLKGNGHSDDKLVGLPDVIASLEDYIRSSELTDFVLVGHSYGGMVITGIADRMPQRIRRLVYWNAFVPNNGESLLDMVPQYKELFASLRQPDGSITLPYEIWRESFINDVDAAMAKACYKQLNAHPYNTFIDKSKTTANPAKMTIAKSYINSTEDTALPQSLGWHPRLSEKLGLFRLVQLSGSHEVCFSNPKLIASKIIDAGRD